MTMATISNVQRHPVRGGLYGLLLGLGVAIYLVLFSVTPFSLTTMALVVVVVRRLEGGFGCPAQRVEERFAHNARASWSVVGPTFELTHSSVGGGAG